MQIHVIKQSLPRHLISLVLALALLAQLLCPLVNAAKPPRFSDSFAKESNGRNTRTPKSLTGFQAQQDSIRQISLTTNDVIYDKNTAALYVSLPSNVGSNGNSVAPVNPITGDLGPSVFVGSEPGKLAVSDNGQYLYVGLNGAAAVRRLDVASQTPGLQFALEEISLLVLTIP